MCKWEEFEKTIKKLGIKSELMAFVELDETKKCNYKVVTIEDASWKGIEGWVYFIVIDGRLTKIGKTDKTLHSRFNGYTSGTTQNRNKGTCSTTNFKISKAFLESLSKDKEVAIYAFNTPSVETNIEVFGSVEKIKLHTALKFESALLSKYRELYGNYPSLSSNSNTY